MATEIESAIRQICDEKGLSYEAVMETIEMALAAAYRKDYGNKMQNIEVEFDTATGGVRAFDVKTVVEDLDDEELEALQARQAELAAQSEAEEAAREAFGGRPAPRSEDKQEGEGEEGGELEDEVQKFNPKTEVMHRDARLLKSGSKIGDVIRTELPVPGEFGRMAAMTAKQVITQKLREAEREIIFGEFKDQEGEILIGTVQRREGRVILVDLGRTVGVIIPEDQVRNEEYRSGERIKVYVREVSLGARGPQILLSRSSEKLVEELFDLEIPEIAEGVVEIKAIAREAGARTKIAVRSTDESIDPIGACIGQRGVRIQTIINELGGEKIDVIEWNESPEDFISAALSPAKVASVTLDEEDQVATVVVDQDQLSLAIGRGGQNVRLASRLSGWRLNVMHDGEEEEIAQEAAKEESMNETEEELKEMVEDAMEEVQEEQEEMVEEVAEEIEEAIEEQAEESEEEMTDDNE